MKMRLITLQVEVKDEDLCDANTSEPCSEELGWQDIQDEVLYVLTREVKDNPKLKNAAFSIRGVR